MTVKHVLSKLSKVSGDRNKLEEIDVSKLVYVVSISPFVYLNAGKTHISVLI